MHVLPLLAALLLSAPALAQAPKPPGPSDAKARLTRRVLVPAR